MKEKLKAIKDHVKEHKVEYIGSAIIVMLGVAVVKLSRDNVGFDRENEILSSRCFLQELEI